MSNLTSVINDDVSSEIKESRMSIQFLEALQELDHMETHPDEYKTYYCIAELKEDLLSDDEI